MTRDNLFPHLHVFVLATTILLGLGSGLTQAKEKPSALMLDRHYDLLEHYCMDCHDSSTKKGQIDLEILKLDLGQDAQMAERWQEVLDVLNAGEMPPKKKEQLTVEEKTDLLAHLSQKLVVARKIHSDSGGVITMRRLNQREYANTIEDLIGIRPEIDGLPSDQGGGGFDTAGASLYLSSDQFEQYQKIALDALKLAMGHKNEIPPSVTRIEAENKHYSKEAHQELLDNYLDAAERGEKYKNALKTNPKTTHEDFGFKSKTDAHFATHHSKLISPILKEYLSRPEVSDGYIMMALHQRIRRPIQSGHFTTEAQEEFTIRFRAASYPDAPAPFRYVELAAANWTDGNQITFGWRKVRAPISDPEIIEFKAKVPAGKRVSFMLRLREQQTGSKRNDTIYRNRQQYHTPMGVWLDWMEIERSGRPAGPTKTMAKLIPPMPEDMEENKYVHSLLENFAQQAFRGSSPSSDYLEKLTELFSKNRAKGQPLEKAILQPLSIILSSPSFLYMVESTGGERLTETELAVRLSYFLWSSPPDDELMRAAKNWKLSDPAELARQTTRLLKDQRADRFIRDFAFQWLEMDRLGIFPFDSELYEKFDNAVVKEAAEEIYQTIRHHLDHQLPLNNLLKSDFVVVNDVMADFYDLPPVDSHFYRRVNLPSNSKRGGLLSTAAVLAMGSNGIRTSPVERGAWVLRHLLHDPPPPAPPNVPQLERLDDKVLSSRELGIAHQEEAQCVQCHRKIDPIGYALENFDAAGLWRESEVVRFGKKNKESKTFPIDPAGKLPDGTQFNDFFELRDVVASRSDDFARGFTEAIIAYGLGRPYGFSDYNLAESILQQTKKHGYPIDQIIHALVQHRIFQTK